MTLPDYKRSYSVLGVFQDDDWDTIRNAYKRLIRKWHPDRFLESGKKEFAENKCKEINLSFRILDDFYRQHGHLPIVEMPDQATSISSATNSPVDAKSAADNTVASEVGQAWNSPDSAPGNNRRGMRAVYILITAAAAGYWVMDAMYSEHADTHGIAVVDRTLHPSVTNVLPDPDGAGENANPSNTSVSNTRPNQWDSETPASPLHLSPAKELLYITIGSTKQDVLALQGRPSRETENSWEYGLSRIGFTHGRVSDWYENPMNPLRVRK